MSSQRGLKRTWARIRAWAHPEVADAEMLREMGAHLALLTEALEQQGHSPSEARRRARLSFGSGEAAVEAHRETRGIAWLEQTARDLRLALRSLRRAPAFTTAAILTLGLGLGATLAVFTVVNSVLLEPLSYPYPEQLVALRQMAPGAGAAASSGDGLDLSLSMYVTYAEHNRSFLAMGVWNAGTASITGIGRPEHVKTVVVSDGVLQALAVPALFGRWFTATDYDLRRTPTVMLSYGFWQRQYGGAPDVVGRTLDVDGTPRTIVGVMPRGFRVVERDADLIVPITFDRADLKEAGFGFTGLARLKPGATLSSANADLARLLPVWMDSWRNCPKCDTHFYERWHITPALRALKDDVVGGASRMLWAILATAALVMLIAAGNVINLFLVRAEARQQELAVRAALGAGRGRIARQLLTEAAVVAAAGCALGLLLAQLAVVWLQRLGPSNLPRLQDIALHGRVVLAGIVLTAVAALLIGLVPMLRRATASLAPALGSETRSASGSRQRRRVRSGLAVVQMAMALVLLVAAGLLLRAYAGLRAVSPGISIPQSVQTFRLAIPPVPRLDDAAVTRTQNNILDRLAAIPGVEAVGFIDELPTEGTADWDVVAKRGAPFLQGSTPPVRGFSYISPGYLAAVGSRIVAGRDFRWGDIYGLQRDVLISENLAREFWGGAQAAIGQQVSPSGPGNWYRVIGVVQDVRQDGLEKPSPALVYWPALTPGLWNNATLSRPDVAFVLRTDRAGSAPLQAEIRRAIAAVNPALPLAAYATLQQVVDRSTAVPAFTTTTLALAGVLAFALGLVGIYGVVAYDVAQRRREVGIRLALGSSRAAVQRMFVRQGMGLALIGAGIGLTGAALLTQTLTSLLYGVSPLDPITFVAAPLILLVAVLAASTLPARRAAATDPGEVLRD